jgi:UDP-glucose 4-epimerase
LEKSKFLHTLVASNLKAMNYEQKYKEDLEAAKGWLAIAKENNNKIAIQILEKLFPELFESEDEIKIIGIRHGEKMYETLLTNEECSNATDMGDFYRVPCDKRDLNYDKYFKDGDVERNPLTEFNSSNTELLDVEQVKEKLLTLQYIRDELEAWRNR